jgi:ribose transport system substrate-binding protein
MSVRPTTPLKRILMASGALLATTAVLVGCTSNDPEPSADSTASSDTKAASDNDAPGDEVVIGFSGPQADHGWLAAINSAAAAEAVK